MYLYFKIETLFLNQDGAFNYLHPIYIAILLYDRLKFCLASGDFLNKKTELFKLSDLHSF